MALGRKFATALQRSIGQYRTTDVAGNLGKSLSGAQRKYQKKTEVILTVKLETRHPVRGPFGRSFKHLQPLRSYDGLTSQDLDIL